MKNLLVASFAALVFLGAGAFTFAQANNESCAICDCICTSCDEEGCTSCDCACN